MYWMLSAIAVLLALGATVGPSLLATTGAGAAAQSVLDARAMLRQNVQIIASEAADADGDGWKEPPAAGGTAAPLRSSVGTPLEYCVWDNGSVSTSGGRLPGVASPTAETPAFSLIWPGSDGVTATDCETSKTAGIGDDLVHLITLGQLAQGVTGNAFYGDPVETEAQLYDLPASGLRNGEIRLVKATSTLATWNANVQPPRWDMIRPAASDTITAPSYTGPMPVLANAGGLPVLAASYHTALIDSQGQLWAAGHNASGQLGVGDTSPKATFGPLPSIDGVSRVWALGESTVVQRGSRLLYAGRYWNDSGGVTNSTTFADLGYNGADVRSVGGYYVGRACASCSGTTTEGGMLAVDANGALWAPDGNFSFVRLAESGWASAPKIAISVEAAYNYAIDTAGRLYGWAISSGSSSSSYATPALGPNSRGQGFAGRTLLLPQTYAAAGGDYHAAAIRTDGTVWVIGSNSVGQLGIAGSGTLASFTQVPGLANATNVAAAPYATFVLLENGELYATGEGAYCKLGTGTTANQPSFVLVATNVSAVHAGGWSTIIAKRDGTVWGVGVNSSGQLAQGHVNSPMCNWVQVL